MEAQTHAFLTLTQGEGEWSALHRDHFPSKEGPLVPIDRRVDESQSQCLHLGEVKNVYSCQEI